MACGTTKEIRGRDGQGVKREHKMNLIFYDKPQCIFDLKSSCR